MSKKEKIKALKKKVKDLRAQVKKLKLTSAASKKRNTSVGSAKPALKTALKPVMPDISITKTAARTAPQAVRHA